MSGYYFLTELVGAVRETVEPRLHFGHNLLHLRELAFGGAGNLLLYKALSRHVGLADSFE